MSYISLLFYRNRTKIAFTYGLTLGAHLCTLSYPALTGIAIDGLLKQEFVGLTTLISIWLLHLILAFIRQRYDTRVFMGIYADLATATALRQHGGGRTISTVSARVELARDVVNFFEVEIPAIAFNVVTVIGSLVILYIFDLQAGLIATCVLLPMAIINGWFWRKAQRLHFGIHNQIEREVGSLITLRPSIINRHYRLLRRWKVALSDAESWTWAGTELATIIALIFILIDFTSGSTAVTAGAIYAVLVYIFNYLEGLDNIPNVINGLTKLTDVRRRLEENE